MALESFLKSWLSPLISPSREDAPWAGTLSRDTLIQFAAAAKNELNASLAMLTAVDHFPSAPRFELVLILHVPSHSHYVVVRTPIPLEDPTFPSLTGIFANANWPEREIRDMFGIIPWGHPDSRPLVWKGGWPHNVHPLRKDVTLDRAYPVERVLHPIVKLHGDGVYETPVGPIHAGIIEPGHFRFQTVGDTLLALDAQLFFCHRGLEKIAENREIIHALLLAERQCGTCSVSNALSYCLAVERASGIIAPPRARMLRVFLSEFERLYNHVNDVGAIAAGVGLAFVTQQSLRIKEEFQRRAAALCGHRFLRNLFLPGGMRQDFSNDALKEAFEQIRDLVGQGFKVVEVAFENSIYLDRLETTGVLTSHNAQELRAVGPVARASGIKADTRCDHPHDGYVDLPGFEPQFRKFGDVMARFRLRLDEMPVSLNLMEAAMKALPDGAIAVPVPQPGSGTWGLGATESPRGENLCLIQFGENGRISRYASRTASYCNWPCIPTTIQGNIIPDFPLINKSFELCYADVDR